MEIEKFKVNRDFVWRFNNITVGTIKKDSIITILQKDYNSLLLSNGIGVNTSLIAGESGFCVR